MSLTSTFNCAIKEIKLFISTIEKPSNFPYCAVGCLHLLRHLNTFFWLSHKCSLATFYRRGPQMVTQMNVPKIYNIERDFKVSLKHLVFGK